MLVRSLAVSLFLVLAGGFLLSGRPSTLDSRPRTALAPIPGGPQGGDPVDLPTGLYVLTNTDLYVPGPIPIELIRTYRTLDERSRAFGIGATHDYEVFLVGDNRKFTWIELILADGARVHYDRTSPGSSWNGAVFRAHSIPREFATEFDGSTLAWNGNGWDLKLLNGTTFSFPAAHDGMTPSQGALTGIRDYFGNTLACVRDPKNGNLLQIVASTGRWVGFLYDANNRVTHATSSTGRVVRYTYDAGGRLCKVVGADGEVSLYTYDTSHRLLTVAGADGVPRFRNHYDANGRVVLQTHDDGGAYKFVYTLDAAGNLVGTDVTDPNGDVESLTFDANGYTLAEKHSRAPSK